MGVSPLEGCWAKLGRAKQTTDVIEQEECAYLSGSPPPVRMVGAHEGTEYVFRAFGPNSAPLQFAILAGESIHHLRSSLDHIVWALVVKHIGLPNNRIQFPICDTRDSFERALKAGVIKGVGSAAAKLIESVQPFTSETPRQTILYVLHQLDIIDKHKLLVVTATAAELGETIVFGDNAAMPKSPKNPNIVGLGSPAPVLASPTGARAFAVQFKEPSPQVTVDADFEFKLAFENVPNVGPCIWSTA